MLPIKETKYQKCLTTTLRFIPGITPILLFRLLGGLYYPVGSKRQIHLAAKLFCVMTVLCVTFNYIKQTLKAPTINLISRIIQLTQYLGNFTIAIIFNGENFMNLLNNIRIIDVVLDFRPTHDVLFSSLLWILALSCRVAAVFLLWVNYFNYVLPISLVAEVWLECTVCSSHFTRIMTFELLWSRMKALRKRFEIDMSTMRRFETSDKHIKEEINKCIMIYQQLLNILHQTKFPFKVLVRKSKKKYY